MCSNENTFHNISYHVAHKYEIPQKKDKYMDQFQICFQECMV